GSVALSWSAPVEGAAPTASYRVERAVNGGAFGSLATTVAPATKYEDATAVDLQAAYSYRVAAVNVYGAGAPSNMVTPALPSGTICGAPGLTIAADAAGDVV